MDKLPAKQGVKSCLRVLDVLEFFVEAAAPARTVAISRALGIPNSSADEILRTMVGAGYLNYNRHTKLYAPSYKLVSASSSIARRFFAGDYIADLLDDLRRATGATVFLTGQNDCWIELVATARGSWSVSPEEVDYPLELIAYRSDKGRWQPGTNFAAAMLAQQSNVEVMDGVSRAQKLGLGPERPALMTGLIEAVARTRAQGFAAYRRTDRHTLDSIAFPLPVPGAVTPHSVGIVGDRLFERQGAIADLAGALRGVLNRYPRPSAPRAPAIH